MRRLLVSCFLFAVMLAAVAPGSVMSQRANRKAPANLVGRWRVKFAMGGWNKNLIFIARPKNVGSFLLLDTGPDDKPVKSPQPAVWSILSDDRVSFVGEAELPLGTCCREWGTLNLKGKFDSSNSISGRLLFVTSQDDDESPFKYRALVGTFTATRLPK